MRIKPLAVVLLFSAACFADTHSFKPGDEPALQMALDAAQPGDVFRFAPGTYHFKETIRLKSSGTDDKPITFEAEAINDRPIFDFSEQPYGKESRGIQINADRTILRGIEVVGAGDNGINVAGSFNTVESCRVHECRDSGIQIATGGGHNLITGCDSFRNVDVPNRGENADGFAAKGKLGPGNVFRNCRAWENADDGFDFWESPEPILLEDSVAIRNGINFWKIETFAGDGNGFKLGGNFVAGNHTVIRCYTSEQSLRGFNLNNNTGAITLIDCIATNCTVGFYLPTDPKDGSRHVVKGCVSVHAPSQIAPNAKQENNHFDATTKPTE